MKFSWHLPVFLIFILIFVFLFQSLNSSNLISESCKEASKNDKNLSYDFCVAALEDASLKVQPPPSNLEGLVLMSIQLIKSNGTNMVSTISKFLNDTSFDQYAKACLHDCFDLYSDALSDLDDAVDAFKSRNFDTAATRLSTSMDNSITCQFQFKEKGKTSPLANANQLYFQLNAISLGFIQMIRQDS